MAQIPLPEAPKPTGDATSCASAVLTLIRLVGALAPRVDFERSFKLSQGRLAADRLLLGVAREARTGAAGDEDFTAVCRAIGMPSELLQDFRLAARAANHVYFGAERDAQSVTFKAYLEFRNRIMRREPDPGGAAKPHELFVGYKWDPADPARRAVSHYRWWPGLAPAEILRRVQAILDSGAPAGLRDLTVAMTSRAMAGGAPEALQYVEVREDGNARRSFDINVYKTGQRLLDLRAELKRAQVHFELDEVEFDSLLQRIGSERLGHLAAGIDRQGRGFVTAYYGGVTLDGRRLTQATLAGSSR